MTVSASPPPRAAWIRGVWAGARLRNLALPPMPPSYLHIRPEGRLDPRRVGWRPFAQPGSTADAALISAHPARGCRRQWRCRPGRRRRRPRQRTRYHRLDLCWRGMPPAMALPPWPPTPPAPPANPVPPVRPVLAGDAARFRGPPDRRRYLRLSRLAPRVTVAARGAAGRPFSGTSGSPKVLAVKPTGPAGYGRRPGCCWAPPRPGDVITTNGHRTRRRTTSSPTPAS